MTVDHVEVEDDEPIIYAVLTQKQMKLIIGTLIKERHHLHKVLEKQQKLTELNISQMHAKIDRLNEAIQVLLIERKNQKERM